jgi:hypothetical protein
MIITKMVNKLFKPKRFVIAGYVFLDKLNTLGLK